MRQFMFVVTCDPLLLVTLLVVCSSAPIALATMLSKTFTVKVNSTGGPLCAVDKPSSVISMGASTMGGQCGVQCTVSSSCQLYQFKENTPQCELYDIMPSNFATTDHCTAYAVTSVVKSASSTASFMLNVTGTVRGVSFLGDLLFFTRYGANQVFVYNATSFQPVRQLTYPGSIISDLATDITSNTIFAIEAQRKSIFRFDPWNYTSPQTSWTFKDSSSRLWVNRVGNILVTQLQSTVTKFTQTGVLISNSSVIGGIKLGQAVEMSDGTMVVTARDQRLSGLVALSPNGTVMGVYGNSTDTAVGRMNMPMGLSVTEQDYLLVADTSNGRILVVNPSLSDARQLPLPLDIVQPNSLCLDERRGRLYIGEEAVSGRLLAFDSIINIDALFNN